MKETTPHFRVIRYSTVYTGNGVELETPRIEVYAFKRRFATPQEVSAFIAKQRVRHGYFRRDVDYRVCIIQEQLV